VPHAVVADRAAYVDATNSWRMLLTEDVWTCHGVISGTVISRRTARSATPTSRRSRVSASSSVTGGVAAVTGWPSRPRIANTAFILLTPTRYPVEVSLAEKMAGWKSRTAALADLLEGNGAAFAATEAARTLLAEFHAAVLPVEETKARMRFPTPAGATWGDVTIKFIDGHRVSVRCKTENGVFNFTDMGMVDRRKAEPDVQWALLYALAVGHGRMNWRSSEARRENAKRKQTLNERLAAFFGIDGESITWDKNAKNYLCRFTLQPEGD
jgi:hypothetical protein